jgi:flagellar motor switch protein FliM
MANLRRVSGKLLEPPFNDENLPRKLPEVLSKAIEEALNEVVFIKSGPVYCRLESISECDLSSEASRAAAAGDLSIPIIFESSRSHASVVISGNFVHRVIDTIFGSSVREPSSRISPIEIAIAEFLTARIVAQINERVGNELFSVGEASVSSNDLFGEPEAGAIARMEVRADGFSHSFQLLISRAMLSSLRKTLVFEADPDDAISAKVSGALRSIPLRAQIGSTTLDSTTIAFLEPGDVVIVEESQLGWSGGSPDGEVRLLAGVGDTFVLTGEIARESIADAGTIRVLLKDIFSREPVPGRSTGRFIMDDQTPAEGGSDAENLSDVKAAEGSDAQDDGEVSTHVENLRVRLRVELAGVNVSLREINGLRVGQVIDLGRGPTDAVSLVADGSDETVAVGELVDIEGRLGVRLTKVFI